ncbi:hypothetical protein GQ457_01G015910 [Hibiscus cannabinus]
MWEFQDKELTELERKNRDKACKKYKLNKKSLEVSELSGRSLSDTDLSTRWDILTKEAQKALKLGKKIGMGIEGNEEEVGELRSANCLVSGDGFGCESLDFKEIFLRVKGIDCLIQEMNNGNSEGLLSVGDKRKFKADSKVLDIRVFLVRGRWEQRGIIWGISTSLEVEVDELGVLVHPLAGWNLTSSLRMQFGSLDHARVDWGPRLFQVINGWMEKKGCIKS